MLDESLRLFYKFWGIYLLIGVTVRFFDMLFTILKNFLELSWTRIASLSDQDKYDLANAFLSTFWFVGDYQLCDDYIGVLGAQLGISPSTSSVRTRRLRSYRSKCSGRTPRWRRRGFLACHLCI